MKQTIAKIIRVISIPPVLVTAMLLILFFTDTSVMRNTAELFITLTGLAIFPVLAYPLTAAVPTLRRGGRRTQRNLAIILSAVGYFGVWLFGLLAGAGDKLMLILNCYLISVALLIVFNKLLKIHASGHACGITGPIVICGYFLGMAAIIPDLILFSAIFWASIETKRHTVKEFLLGMSAAVASFLISLLIYII